MNAASRARIAILARALVASTAALVAGPVRSAAAEPSRPAAASSRETGASHRGVSERARLTIEPAGHPFTHLAIENPLGDVKVEGYDGAAIQIESHKFATDEDALDRLHVSLVPNPDGTVSIKTTADGGKEARPVLRRQVRIDLVIRAPRNARIEAAASSGALEVINMDAGSDLDTASGSISVRNVQGEVLTHSVSGLTRLVQVFGTVDAQTLTSDLNLDTISGDRLFASVHHGKIEGRRIRARDVELTATEGQILLEAEAALRGHLLVSTFKGDVDVQLHRHGAVMVRAQGTKVELGTLMQPGPNGWVESSFGQVTSDAAIVEIRSPQGNVRFAIIESRP